MDDSVGALVKDADNETFGRALGETIARALIENWKPKKSAAAIERASRYTLTAQCQLMVKNAELA